MGMIEDERGASGSGSRVPADTQKGGERECWAAFLGHLMALTVSMWRPWPA